MELKNQQGSVWTIQHCCRLHKDDNDWRFSSFDNIASSVYKETYDAWARTGIRGFLSEKEGIEALRKIVDHNRKRTDTPAYSTYKFRLVRIDFNIRVNVIVTGEVYETS